jgi:serine/threonine protein kinase
MVVYESICGHNPLLSNTLRETLTKVSQANVPDIRQLVSDCPEPVARFLQDALSRNPRRRPNTATEFKEKLLGVLADIHLNQQPRSSLIGISATRPN